MSNIHTNINEYVANQKNSRYYLKQIVRKIWKMTGEKPQIRFDDFTEYLYLSNIERKYEDKIVKMLKAQADKLYRLNIWMTWKTYLNRETKLIQNDKDFFDFEPGRLLLSVTIKLKDIFVKRIIPTRYVYHASDIKNRKQIKKQGLKASYNKNWKSEDLEVGHPKAVFATNSKIKDWFQTALMNTNEVDIWQIDTSKIPNHKWYQDMNLTQREGIIMTLEDIPRKAIKISTWKDRKND